MLEFWLTVATLSAAMWTKLSHTVHSLFACNHFHLVSPQNSNVSNFLAAMRFGRTKAIAKACFKSWVLGILAKCRNMKTWCECWFRPECHRTKQLPKHLHFRWSKFFGQCRRVRCDISSKFTEDSTPKCAKRLANFRNKTSTCPCWGTYGLFDVKKTEESQKETQSCAGGMTMGKNQRFVEKNGLLVMWSCGHPVLCCFCLVVIWSGFVVLWSSNILTGHRWTYTVWKKNMNIPGTQMSLVLIGNDLLLETKQRTNWCQV